MNTELAPRHADDTVLKQAGSPQSLLADAKVSENLYANHLSFWNKKSIALEEIVWKLPDECVNELENVCENGQVEKTNNLQTDLPKTVEFTDKLRTALSFGSGIAIVDGFRVKHNSEEANRLQCKLFSSLLATLMPQNISGDILYDVKDKKVANPEGVRKSITNAEQPFHTDGGWMNPPARFIGLFCLANANTGGVSLATSLYSAFKSLSDTHQKTLLHSLPWDKQGEYFNGESPVAINPGFQFTLAGEFIGRFYESYVRNGYSMKLETIPDSVCEALTELSQELKNSTSVKFTMKPGQYQFVNNWNMVHARLAFTDSGYSTRHLIRTWYV